MKALLFLIIGLLPCFSQLTFEATEVSLTLDPKENSITIKFPFEVNSTSSIASYFTHCGCLKAITRPQKWESGQRGTLELELDTTNIIGTTRKSIEVTFENHPTQMLTVEATMPKAISWTPKTHIWKSGSPPNPKTFEITVLEGYEFKIKELTPSNQKFTLELTSAPKSKSGKTYYLNVTPPNGEGKEICMIKVTTTSEVKRHQSFNLLTIKQ